jgi:hypothetical protein
VQNGLDVINSVAQELTALPPAADFRARVMDRINAEPARSRFVWHWKLVLVPVAVAAVVFVVARHRPDTQTIAPAVRNVAVASTGVEQSLAASPINAVASTSTTRNTKPAASRPSNRRIHRANAEELAWRERAVLALTPIDPLDLEDIQPTALSIPQLEVKPLGAAADGGSPNDKSSERHD